MALSRLDFSVQQYADFDLLTNVVDASGAPIDLTTAVSASMQIRSNYAQSVPWLSLTKGAGINLGLGTVEIVLTNAQTSSLPVSLAAPGYPPSASFVYDLYVTYASGQKSRLMYGIITATASVTRS